jgi:hypothetical protein
MNRCIQLSVAHFLAGILYGSGALWSSHQDPLMSLVVAVPISFTMALFYSWIMQALAEYDLLTKYVESFDGTQTDCQVGHVQVAAVYSWRLVCGDCCCYCCECYECGQKG